MEKVFVRKTLNQLALEEKIDKFNYTNMYAHKFFMEKPTKGKVSRLRKITVTPIRDKGLISLKYKELLQINENIACFSNGLQAKAINRKSTEKEPQITH